MIRKIGVWVFGFLFSLTLGAAIGLYIGHMSTSYEFLNKNILPIVEKNYINISENQTTQMLYYLKYECFNKEEIYFDKLEGFNFTISCSDVSKLKSEDVVPYIGEKILNETYFKHYSCENLKSCWKENKMYFISEDFHKKIFEWFEYSVVAMLVFLALYVYLIGVADKALTSVGGIVLSESIPFFIITYLISNYIPVSQYTSIVSDVSVNYYNFFLTLSIIGAAMVTLGHFIRLFKNEHKKKH